MVCSSLLFVVQPSVVDPGWWGWVVAEGGVVAGCG